VYILLFVQFPEEPLAELKQLEHLSSLTAEYPATWVNLFLHMSRSLKIIMCASRIRNNSGRVFCSCSLTFFKDQTSNSKLEFLPWRPLCNSCQLSLIMMGYWQYHHSCLWDSLSFSTMEMMYVCIWMHTWSFSASIATRKPHRNVIKISG